MNPLKWLINDLKQDWKAIKRIGRIMEGREEYSLKELQKKSPIQTTKQLYFTILLILAFSLISWTYSARYYENECNAYILDNYLNDTIELPGYMDYSTLLNGTVVANSNDYAKPLLEGSG